MFQILIAILLATGNPMIQAKSTNTCNTENTDNVPDTPGGEQGHIPTK